MKVMYIGVWRNEGCNKSNPPVELCNAIDVSKLSYFTQKPVAGFLTFFSGVVAAQTRPDVGLEVTEEGHKFHACGSDQGVCAVAVSDDEYPSHVAQQLLRKVINGFCTKYPRTAWASMTKDSKHLSFPELKDHLVNYQDPRNADPISKIQQELDETKIVIHKTINSVLERGEKIDDLVAKSDNLSAQSKMFYTQAKKQNSCCVVM